jgi:hypothetical protein
MYLVTARGRQVRHSAMDRISSAVETCLAHAIGDDRPFIRVSEFIEELKRDKTWTSNEIVEVQTKVIRALILKIRPSE